MGSQFQAHLSIGESKDSNPSLKVALQQAWRWSDIHRHGARQCLSVGTPLVGFSTLEVNDMPALFAAVDSLTVAVLIRPLAGTVISDGYWHEAAQLCQELKILLMVDERLLPLPSGLAADLIFQETQSAAPTVVYLPLAERWLSRLGQAFH